MHIAFFNPQGNFDPKDSHWMEHPDFGGQLVYVKELALALGVQGHSVDIITRRIIDDRWPEFAAPLDGYPDQPRVRIVRIPCGPPEFLPKEELWPYLGTEWVPGIIAFYEDERRLPDAVTAHYADGGLSAALFRRQTGAPFTFTAHSLGAQKMDKLGVTLENLTEWDTRFHFARRIAAERVAMSHAGCIITSTRQERFGQCGHCAYRGAVDVHDEGRFAVIPPGVNRAVFSPDPTDLDAAIEERIEGALNRDLPPERRNLPLVLCSARLDRKKNHIGLVKAFAQSAELRAAANLALVVRGLENPLRDHSELQGGERAVLDEIVSVLNEHDLWNVVTSFPPWDTQRELAAVYRVGARRRWVFALVSLHEPFGLAPLEAMSCGLPVVVTESGGPSESLRDEDTGREYGLLVDPADSADIARGLLQALAPEAWERYHRAGQERVQTCFTWESTAEGYLKVLEEILSGLRTPEGELAPIPAYFTQPIPKNDIRLMEQLAIWYFNSEQRRADDRR